MRKGVPAWSRGGGAITRGMVVAAMRGIGNEGHGELVGGRNRQWGGRIFPWGDLRV